MLLNLLSITKRLLIFLQDEILPLLESRNTVLCENIGIEVKVSQNGQRIQAPWRSNPSKIISAKSGKLTTIKTVLTGYYFL